MRGRHEGAQAGEEPVRRHVGVGGPATPGGLEEDAHAAGAGVVNFHCTGLAISVPLVDRSPAATAAVYVVEYGKRPSASNAIICVPSHLNLPRGCGVIDIGERSSLRSSIDASGIIGWLKTAVTEPTRPGSFMIGLVRSNCSGPAGA